MRLTSFSFRIFLLFSIVTTGIVLLTGFLLATLYYITSERTIKTTLQNRANTLIRDHISFDPNGLVYRLGEEGETITSRLRDFDASVVIFDSRFTRIGTYGYYKNLVLTNRLADLAPSTLITQVFESGKSVYNDAFIDNQLFDVFTTPLLFDNTPVGVLQISVQNTLLHTMFTVGKTVLLFVLPLTILLSWISVYLTTRFSFRPFKELTGYMERATYSSLPPPLAADTMKFDELRMMFESFNSMIKRLKDAIGIQQSYADHLSHELKTPLSRAVSTLDIAAHHIEQHEDATAVGNITDTQQELLTLGKTIDTILQITGNNNQKSWNSANDVVYAEKEINILLDQHKGEIKKKKLAISQNIRHDLSVVFPIDHFRMIAGNLLSNAIKYTNAHGTITIDALTQHSKVTLVVTNTGIPISPETIPTLFLRYVRGAVHRIITPGTGLGLPLVKDLCELHALKLEIHSDKQQTSVSVRGFTC